MVAAVNTNTLQGLKKRSVDNDDRVELTCQGSGNYELLLAELCFKVARKVHQDVLTVW